VELTVPVVLQQTDSLSSHIDNVAGSGLVAGAQTENIELQDGGTPGTTPLTFVVSTEAVRAHVFMESAVDEPNQARWPAGTWSVLLNVSGFAGTNARIRRCYIFRVGKNGVNHGLVGATIDFNIACTFGVKTLTVVGVETWGDPLDRVQVILGMNKTAGTPTVKITPNKTVTTPILKAA